MQLDAKYRASGALLCYLFDAPTALAACCGFDLCHKYIWYLVFSRKGVPQAQQNCGHQ